MTCAVSMNWEEVYHLLYEGLKMPLTYLINADKRIYFLYLISSILLAYFVYHKTKKNYSFLQYIFHKKVWTSQSAITDYLMVFFNGVFKVFLIGPYLIYGLYLAFYTNEFWISTFGYASFSLSTTQTLILYTITLTIVGDFATYVVHYTMHKIPWLWEFHKIHHSATSLNPVTQYRIHPIELLINNAKSIIVFGVVTGTFDYLSNHQVNKMMFLGANVFSVLFLFWGANLRHSHVKLKYYNFLEYIFISPVQHQIHHSNNEKHFDKNMGAKLAIWDWLFGTLIRSRSVGKLQFGLGKEDPYYNSFLKNLYMPFLNILGWGSKRKK